MPEVNSCLWNISRISWNSGSSFKACIDKPPFQSQGKKSPLCEICVLIAGQDSKKCSLDVRSLAAPRQQAKPKGVPTLQIPGVNQVNQPMEPLIGIFDNFDAMIEAEKLARGYDEGGWPGILPLGASHS